MQHTGKSAYCFGYGAAKCGKPYSSNPHQPSDRDYSAWAAGYDAATGHPAPLLSAQGFAIPSRQAGQ
jgi:hypothetical protein